MHGAHKSRNALQGADHPSYKNGEETKKAKAERSKRMLILRYLTDLGSQCNLFNKTLKPLGRPPKGYRKLHYSDSDSQLIGLLLLIEELQEP
jgi:hypothetical protein